MYWLLACEYLFAPALDLFSVGWTHAYRHMIGCSFITLYLRAYTAVHNRSIVIKFNDRRSRRKQVLLGTIEFPPQHGASTKHSWLIQRHRLCIRRIHLWLLRAHLVGRWIVLCWVRIRVSHVDLMLRVGPDAILCYRNWILTLPFLLQLWLECRQVGILAHRCFFLSTPGSFTCLLKLLLTTEFEGWAGRPLCTCWFTLQLNVR